MEWDEPKIIYQRCNETIVDGETLLCGLNGTKEVRLRSEVGGGIVEEVTTFPCQDCSNSTSTTAHDRQEDRGEKG